MKCEQVDVLVIGAGPSGAVAASILKQDGWNVKIVEKQRFPRFVIGESLLPRCMECFEKAGFLDALSQHGFQQKFGAKFIRGGKICDFNFKDQFTSGWNWTWQVTRADFDSILTNQVQKMGVPIDFDTEVTAISFNGTDSITTVKNPSGVEQEIQARFIIDASGFGRVIPRLFKLDRPSNLPARKSLFAHVTDPLRANYDEPNRISIVCNSTTTWTWIIPLTPGCTSLGFVGFPEDIDRFPGTPREKLRGLIDSNPMTRERFANIDLLFEPCAVEGYSVTTERLFGDGFALTGNATEFLDPIFSSGVTLAAVSGQRAAELASCQLAGRAVNWVCDYSDYLLQGVDVFRSYVMAWYDGSLPDIFFSDNPDPQIKGMICSVLAGYVWDTSNPYVRRHQTALQALGKLVRLRD